MQAYFLSLLKENSMKKVTREAAKETSSSSNKKNTRPHTAKKSGYEENVFNAEEESNYDKTDVAKHNKENTAGPKS